MRRGAPYADTVTAMTTRDRDDELKKDLGAALAARKDLGDEYESALVESFLAKLDAKLESQVERRVRRELAEQAMDHHRDSLERRPRRGGGRGWRRSGMAVSSMVLAIPLSAIGAVNAGLPGLLVTWAGIVAVNAANALPFFPGRPHPDPQEEQLSDWEP